MTATLPQDVQQVFDHFITTEYTTIDAQGQPITWPVTPYHDRERGTIDVTTGLGYPKKARDAQRNPKVSLLFSDRTGCELERPPAVLVQGTAEVDDRNLEANRKRYYAESTTKLPYTKNLYPPEFLQRFAGWYFDRIYVHVRPERVYVWPDGDFTRIPELLDSHMEEIRSQHSEEPLVPTAAPAATPRAWDERMSELGSRHPTAVVSQVAPDGFPVSARLPISVDHQRRLVRLAHEPQGIPLTDGRACVVAHAHDAKFSWQTNFQVRGNLLLGDDPTLEPHKLIGGFELPKNRVKTVTENARKVLRFRKIAKRELQRSARSAAE